MDTTGCPEGYATDIAFQLRTATEPCSTPLAAFWTVLLFVSVVRFAAAVKQAIAWHELNIKLGRRDRKPVAVSLSFAMVIIQVISVFCIGFNVVNVYNGFSWMLYSLNLLPYFFQTSLVLLRFVALGERIIPLGRQLGIKPENHGQTSLRKFSKGGRFLAFLQFASGVASSVALMIMSPIEPSNQDLDGTIGLAFKAQFQFTAAAGAAYQLRRCILVVKRMQQNVEEMNITSSAQTKASIRKMYARMLLGLVMGFSSGIGYALVAFHVLPRNIWWVHLYPGASEAFFAFMLEFVVLTKRNTTGRHSSKEREIRDPALNTSSAGKVEPGVPSAPSSALGVTPATASQSGADDDGSRTGAISPFGGNPVDE